MRHSQITQINYYWANRLKCLPSVFEQPGTIILPCKQPSDYLRIIITRTSKQAIIRIPLEVVKLVTNKLNTAQIATAEDVMAVFVNEEIELGWRDFIWYFPPQVNLLPPDSRVRPLSNSDRLALDELMAACTEEERGLANVRIEQEFPIGLFENNCLLAVASLIFDGDEIADVGVITHPQHREEGLGKSIVSELVRQGIKHGRIVQYTTQEQNVGSKRLAESIGFWLYAVEEGLYLLLGNRE